MTETTLVLSGIAFVILSFVAASVVVYEMFFARRIDWHDALGVIEESSVQFGEDSPYAMIRYKFLVGDQPYWGNQTSFANLGYNLADVEAFVERHPIGSGVIVYFDPDDPEFKSTLDVKASYTNQATKRRSFTSAVAVIFLLLLPLAVGIGLIYFGLR